ncbi:MAG: hypothetical protein NUV69_01785 [Candidatus Curtissbacteria bacterium]|nr:hypothetical protein [Candidatus Curtissbacteria bacterium]
MADQEIGTVTHYYDKIGVAVVKMEKGDLKLGDSVKLTDKTGKKFTQTVDSMQIKRADIDIAKAGDEFGLKTTRDVKHKTAILKV